MTRSATFVIALWAFNVGCDASRLIGGVGSSWSLLVSVVGLSLSFAWGIHESRKSGRSA